MNICSCVRVWLLATVFVIGSMTAPPGWAQEGEEELGLRFTAEFSTVWTAGNSQSSTLGLASTIRYLWERSEAKLEGGAVRTESTLKSRTAVGTSEIFEIEEDKVTEKTAEAYYVRGRYDYRISEYFFLFGGTDWLRNTFAGIESRLLVAAGAGNAWLDSERMRFKTDYSATYTFQQDVVENPFTKANFPGLRLAYDYWWKLTGSTEFESKLIGDLNLDNTDDVRIDFTNALPVAISSKLALKPSLQLLWRNDPSLTEVPLFASDGTPADQAVLVPLQKLDSFFTISLVVTI
ncbi:MAG: DUF481 domain-containing protein [Gemmatimonadota bacterium]|nr:MAG: DUF481 domain-containing protein [Gemmatimonadota bacterium]